jgi:carbonic anhydrase
MDTLNELLENNRAWADEMKACDPEFFSRLAEGQQPACLWIGCSDSRVPASGVVGALPGELFVHRNIANQVVADDPNGLSVIQYAVSVLEVSHVIVCGHYGCGGVKAALDGGTRGPIDGWLRQIRELHHRHKAEIDAVADDVARVDRMCELNVMEQVANVCRTPYVRDAWASGRSLVVHGLVYDLGEGVLKDLGIRVEGPDGLPIRHASTA